METFEDFKIKKLLKRAVDDLGFETATPIQQESYSTILGGADFVGIAQTGTGKTIAYLLPILQDLKFSDQLQPRVLILAPTRELVIQIVAQIEKLTPYLSVRVAGVYGGSSNIKAQKRAVAEGLDIIVGTPRRLLAEVLDFESEISVIHSSKEQNHRVKSIDKFTSGKSRILVATDVIARGIDIEKISTVISFETPFYPENYIHRIGRTGRAGEKGKSILLYQEKETPLKEAIENLMNYKIPFIEFPQEVPVSTELTPEEDIKPINLEEEEDNKSALETGASFHEKSAKNSKVRPKEKSYERKLKKKYKKPQRRGDKIQNKKNLRTLVF
ncbi:UNVERIFIED_CONTAM: hypothetical protein GTU68_001368 [Idotea baltica]|nr:hypothetical protein [Idotea baltica]